MFRECFLYVNNVSTLDLVHLTIFFYETNLTWTTKDRFTFTSISLLANVTIALQFLKVKNNFKSTLAVKQ